MDSPWISGLPLRPKPHANEGLVAYCWRLAASNGLSLPPDFKGSVLSDQRCPGPDSPTVRLLGVGLAQQLWERESNWLRQGPCSPPRWPRRCPRCAREQGVHYALLDASLIAACPIHGCKLTDRCLKCNRPLTWLRLRQGFVCECGADFTKAVTGNASPVQLLTAQFVAGARDHALISPPKAPISGFEYSSGELYDVLTWAEAVRGACRRPTPLVYLHYSADSVSSKTQALHASDLAAVRLLSSLPDSIHDKARRLRRWVCRYKQGPLVLWARDPIVVKIIKLQSSWATRNTALVQAITSAVRNACVELTDGPLGLPCSCFHPRYSRQDIALLLDEFSVWWVELSDKIPVLEEHSQFPSAESSSTVEVRLSEDIEQEVVDLLNLLFKASHRRLPLEVFLPLLERWRLPPALRTGSVTAESVTAYLIALRPSERSYLGDLLRFCITGTPGQYSLTARFFDEVL